MATVLLGGKHYCRSLGIAGLKVGVKKTTKPAGPEKIASKEKKEVALILAGLSGKDMLKGARTVLH